MKKIFVGLIILIFLSSFVYADVNIRIEIHNVRENSGKIYVGIYSTENAYKNKRQDMILEYTADSTIIIGEINLPEGEYVIDAYQDINNNGRCDLGWFNIPKEPVGMTNYDGGIPGNFNKLKVVINNETESITINCSRSRAFSRIGEMRERTRAKICGQTSLEMIHYRRIL
jgi:uncharacterized protein (DUF2141 family)